MSESRKERPRAEARHAAQPEKDPSSPPKRNLELIKESGLSHPVLFRLDRGYDAIATIW